MPVRPRCDRIRYLLPPHDARLSVAQERPPPVPPSRPYTVAGNTKLGYPQTRVMKMPFPEEGAVEGAAVLAKGDTVLVVGASQRRGHLVVEHGVSALHVPFQFLELKPVAAAI